MLKLRSPKCLSRVSLDRSYPCPCCRHRGLIRPITLTEAFGCDRCQQIYVIRDRGFGLELLSGVHRRSWQWTGHRWKHRYRLPHASYWLSLMVLVLSLLTASVFWVVLSAGARTLAVVTVLLAAGAAFTARR